MTNNMISVEREIPASAEAIFDVLADPRRHSEIDGSDTVQGARVGGPDRLSLGAQFGMKMTFFRLPYQISNTVVEFVENERIAWRHFGRHIWRYELSPTGAGTLVRETFDWSKTPLPAFYDVAGYTRTHVVSMAATLERLETVVTD